MYTIGDGEVNEGTAKRSLDLEMTFEPRQKKTDDFVTPPSKKSRFSLTDSGSASPSTKSGYSSDSNSSSEQMELLELPPFTSTIKCALRDGDCNTSVWNMVNV